MFIDTTKFRDPVLRQAQSVANDMAAEMAPQTGRRDTAEMGWPDMTAEALIESEWLCWFEEELSIARSRSPRPGRDPRRRRDQVLTCEAPDDFDAARAGSARLRE
jgi:hypothetical protein